VIAVALILLAICLALIPAIPLLWGLALIMVLLGGAEGSTDVGGNTLLIWLHGKKVPPFMNGLHFFFGSDPYFPLIIAWRYWPPIDTPGRFGWWRLIIPVVINLLRLQPGFSSPRNPGREG
jgi:FHS family Na+ dependent glucose MFS transporter 1